MKNTKGLSAVVTTLIIILLVLVAVGIVWVVVRNVVDQGSEQLELSSKCLAVDLNAVSVVAGATPGDYDVTLRRAAGGDALGGIKVNLLNATDSSGVLDFSAIDELETQTQSFAGTGLVGADTIEFTAFFTDASGNEQLCTQTGTFNF